MDQSTLNIAAGAAMTCLGWFARMLWDRQDAHSKDLEAEKINRAKAVSEVRELLAGGYVTNSKLGEVIGDIKEDLRYIRDKLDETPQRRAGDPRP